MDDKTLYFSDRLVMWFVVVGAVIGIVVACVGLYQTGVTDDGYLNHTWAWVPLSAAIYAVLGLLVFGATMPFLAWWKMMRLAGIGFLGCVGRFCVIFLIMGAIWTFYAGLADTPVLKVLNGLFLFGLPWTIRDVMRVRKLNEVGGVNLPEVRR